MMRKMTKACRLLSPSSDELWSISNVVRIVLADGKKNDWSFEPEEGEFLDAFVMMVDRFCEAESLRECKSD
jgi:hypothetical protein